MALPNLLPWPWRLAVLGLLILLLVAGLVGLGWSGRGVVAERDRARTDVAARQQQLTQIQHQQAVAHEVAADVDHKQEMLNDNAVRVAAAVGAYGARHSRPVRVAESYTPAQESSPPPDPGAAGPGADADRLDAEWVRLHDAAVPDLVAAPAGPDAATGPVGAAEALGAITRNYAVCSDAIMRLEELQRYLAAQP